MAGSGPVLVPFVGAEHDWALDRLEQFHADGNRLLRQTSAGTTLYIDGREYTDGRDADSLREWIKDALGQ